MKDQAAQSTRETIKSAARRLFVEHGIDNVSIRDILLASGQKNVGAIGYYFKTKDALVQEILVDGARIINARRNALLDELEASGNTITLHDILTVIIRSSAGVEYDGSGANYVRFFALFQTHHSQLFMDAVSKTYDTGYKRCVQHIRQLLPDMPRKILSERIIFMMLLIGVSLANVEQSQDPNEEGDNYIYGGKMWENAHIIDHLIDACVGLFQTS